jgi:hypothetical protein
MLTRTLRVAGSHCPYEAPPPGAVTITPASMIVPKMLYLRISLVPSSAEVREQAPLHQLESEARSPRWPGLQRSPAGLRTRVGSMVDTQVVLG